jgi:hypothetical protein
MADRSNLAPENIKFQEDDAYLILEIDMDEYGYRRQDVNYQGRKFEAKDELHITVLSRDAAEQVQAYMEQEPENGSRIRRLVDETDWSFRKQERYYHVQEDPQVETIIQMVDVQGLESFFRQVSEWVGRELEPPPPHVTLYMRGTEKGIGLPTHEEFERLARAEIRMDELEFLPGNQN